MKPKTPKRITNITIVEIQANKTSPRPPVPLECLVILLIHFTPIKYEVAKLKNKSNIIKKKNFKYCMSLLP